MDSKGYEARVSLEGDLVVEGGSSEEHRHMIDIWIWGGYG